ncbi:Sister chromatid cohesion 1 protein 3 [Camellia lanceoleosa]|uniref:Sister chromatid cohesion 1 protein 3 n=1 Tax=Camellia lanceoleosa TaxID=1840588 RepID=A0ACC0IH81_9ERIC|nr:Sister chromatid cohesion 1 protein 3 [Camellia lanceoleosa]
MNEKEILPPVAEEILVSGGQSLPSQQHGERVSSASSDKLLTFLIHMFHLGMHHLNWQCVQCHLLASQKFMKAALDNCSDLLRKRKCCPSSALDVWKSNNRLRKEKIFLEPLMTGLCADLCNVYTSDFIAAKPHLVNVEEACPEPIVAERDDFTPASAYNLGSQSEPQLVTTVGTGVQPTPDLAASTGALGSELETPMTFLGERLGFENTGLSDIPEVMNSAEADDLSFLASEDYTPTKIQTTQGVDGLSGTTRKVAQYLKGKSSVTPISKDIWVSTRRKNQKR